MALSRGPVSTAACALLLLGSAAPAATVRIEIRTDEFPSETTWEVTDQDGGTTLCAGGPYEDPLMLYITECEIPDEGCFDFTIHDSYGDGICCAAGEGSFAIYDNDALVCEGGCFFSDDRCYNLSGGMECDPGPPPCVVECPPESIPEGEPPCHDGYEDQYNGGCHTGDFQPIACGDVICGGSGTFLYQGLFYRDTDWYQVETTEPMNLTWEATGDFPLLLVLIDSHDGDCAEFEIIDNDMTLPCGYARTDYQHAPPGIYWLWIGPSIFDCVPCEAIYIAEVTCGEACVECPPDATPEGEPICSDDYEDTYNGGCHTLSFQPIEPDEMICGESGTFLVGGASTRDTDWFEFTLEGQGELEWELLAEFPSQAIIIDAGSGDCLDWEIVTFVEAEACDWAQALLPEAEAGLYWLWAAPSVFEGVPCGSPYLAELHVEFGALCPADFNDDDLVNVMDLLALLDAWGESDVPEDLNGDGIVNVLDLLALLGAWGECPE
jgi:hypothetical protein